MEYKILICEDSMEGIFTAIYAAYELRIDHSRIRLQVGESENYTLFAEEIRIAPDKEKTAKVAATIERRLGREAYMDICYALAAKEKEKATAVYRAVVLGLSLPNGRRVMEHLTDDNVRLVANLRRTVWNEMHSLMGFVRFHELENGILFSKIGPKHNVITFLADHFADRLPLENFVIYDEMRSIFLVHPAGKAYFYVMGETLDEAFSGNYSEREKEYQELFGHFCHTIAIKERENTALQRQLLPIRFREYMVEF